MRIKSKQKYFKCFFYTTRNQIEIIFMQNNKSSLHKTKFTKD